MAKLKTRRQRLRRLPFSHQCRPGHYACRRSRAGNRPAFWLRMARRSLAAFISAPRS